MSDHHALIQAFRNRDTKALTEMYGELSWRTTLHRGCEPCSKALRCQEGREIIADRMRYFGATWATAIAPQRTKVMSHGIRLTWSDGSVHDWSLEGPYPKDCSLHGDYEEMCAECEQMRAEAN